MSLTISVVLSEREMAALRELAEEMELSPERVMVCALRVYQMVKKGHAVLIMEPELPMKAPPWEIFENPLSG